MLRKTIKLILVVILFSSQVANAQEKTFKLNTVVIDAGHGGKDPGAIIGNVKEKDIVLDVALRTGKLIQQQFLDVKVIYTREKDEFISLLDRAEIANKQKADLFISIHVNTFQKKDINGAETFILGNHRSEDNLKVAQMENSVILLEDDYTTRYEGFDPNSAESYIMFELIQNEFLEQSRFFADQIQTSFIKNANRKSRGVKQAGFLVLRQTTMPSVLIELGFISNNTEVVYLVSNEGKQNMAQSIAKAFANYKMRNDLRSEIKTNETPLTKSEEEPTIAENKIPNQQTTPKPELAVPVITKGTTPNPPSASNTFVTIDNENNKGKWYGIQILASKKALNINDQLFSETNEPIHYYFENEWHKYYVGLAQNKSEPQSKLKVIGEKFKGAFIVSFNNGKKE